MRKKDGNWIVWAVVLSPFIFLYQKLGPVLFWLVFGFMVIGVLGYTSKRKRNSRPNRSSASAERLKPVLVAVQNAAGEVSMEIDWPETFLVIDHAVHIKDYDFARTWLQKFAYLSVRPEMPQSVRDRFKELMIAFSREDPLYRNILSLVLPLVSAQPGILQTAIYSQIPGYNDEKIRYALYFAHELGDLTRVKKGRSYQLFGSTQTTTIFPGQRIGQAIANSTIIISRNPVDERIAALHREATTHKGVNWDAAITCLQEASNLMRQRDSIFETDRWTRLPTFLQQAGRFDEAMPEFERLLAEVKPRAAKEMSDSRSPSAVKRHTHLNYYRIYDKMRMVCRRQKLHDKAQEYQNLSERHKLVHDELIRVAEIERQAERDAFLQRHEQ